MLSAIDESFAGVRDEGVRYDAIRFAPRWPVTGHDEVLYVMGYEASRSFVNVRYVLRPEGMRYWLKSPAKCLSAHILLPCGKTVSKVLVNGHVQAYSLQYVDKSPYVDFTHVGDGVCDIEIFFDETGIHLH